MLCDFLISLVASYIAVLTSAAGLIDGTAGIVFSVVEVIIVSLLFFTREGKAFTRRVIGSFIAYPLLALLASESGLYEQAFRLFNPQYYNEYGIGFDYISFIFIWLPFAGVMLALQFKSVKPEISIYMGLAVGIVIFCFIFYSFKLEHNSFTFKFLFKFCS